MGDKGWTLGIAADVRARVAGSLAPSQTPRSAVKQDVDGPFITPKEIVRPRFPADPDRARFSWSLTLDAPPIPKGRPRAGKTKNSDKIVMFTPKRTRDAEAELKLRAQATGVRPFDGPVSVVLTFHLPTRRRVDIDNLSKIVDAINGVVWVDDSQIHRLVAEKRYDADRPRTEIEVREMDVAFLPKK